MINKKVMTALLLTMTSGLAAAATIDIRHEYVPDREGDEHRDRLYVAHRFDNQLGFSMEVKWNYKDNDRKSSGHESGISYRWKTSDKFSLTPSFLMDSNQNSTIYKYNLTGAYQIDSNWDVASRFRHAFKNNDHTRYNQINLYANRKFNWGKLGVDLEYRDINGGKGGWKNKGYDQLFEFKAEYTGFKSGIIPFAAIAAVTHKGDGSAYKDEYVARYRAGLKYNF